MKEVTVIAIGVIGVIGLVISLIMGSEYVSCMGYKKTGHKVEWNWGCYVEIEGRWVSRSTAESYDRKQVLKY